MNLNTITRIAEAWPREKQLFWLVQRLWIAELAYQSHGRTDECPCRKCLILRMRVCALEDELLYEPAERTEMSLPEVVGVLPGILKRYGKG